MNLRNHENTIAFIIVASVLALVSLLWVAFKTPSLNPRLEKEDYSIIRSWELPKELDEISGITWIGNNKMACVQDEEGIIFIYDLKKSTIENKINFSKSGDYEGITAVDSTAFVLRSDGLLYEIVNYQKDNFEVKTHKTPFSGKNNMESLAFDLHANRLLLIPKDKDLQSNNFVGIYTYSLTSNKVDQTPWVKINYADPVFKDLKKDKKKSNTIYPSDVAVHPLNKNLYVLEGKNPQLVIFDSKGKPFKKYKLSKDTFNQPEGIVFSPEGTLYISNEGKNGSANILEVLLDK